MDEEKNGNQKSEESKGADNFGQVIDALHNKQKLPSLRTYQGDMAEFIKERNESVISIAVKEKHKKEEKEKEESKAKTTGLIQPIAETPKKAKKSGNFQANFMMMILSLFLVSGGALAIFFVYNALTNEPETEVTIEQEIIPYNNISTLANVIKGNLGEELSKLPASGGINLVKITDTNGARIRSAEEFFEFASISLPPTLSRTLSNDYAIGVFSQSGESSRFLVVSINDFGRAFSAMLDWEPTIEKDLSFLTAPVTKADTGATTTATSTATTTKTVTTPLKQESFYWKDIIIKNKDSRALVNERGKSKIAYAFLDKNTILITEDLQSIGEISSIFASRSIAR